MAKVRLEVLSWLTTAFDKGGEPTGVLVLEEDIEEGEKVQDLLRGLVRRYPKVGKLVFDVKAGAPAEDVMIGLNGRLIQLENEAETRLTDGDKLMLFPIFQGG